MLSPPRLLCAAALLSAASGALVACTYDFEAFDPRLGTGTGSGAGTGTPAGTPGGTASGTPGGTPSGTPTECTPGSTASCYSGEPQTENVGICHGGQMTCNDSGTAFGACEGEVTPTDEDCSTPYDDDCDGQANEPDASCDCTPGTTTACYDGQPSTDGVGRCHAGEQLCLPSGTGYGPCAGQLLPIHENCSTTVDDDCDGNTNDHCATWSLRFNAYDPDAVWGLAVDSADNLLLAGSVTRDISFGGPTLPGGWHDDVYVAKLSPTGSHLWSKRYGDTEHQVAMAVAVDPSDNVYLGGIFAGTIDFGGGYSVTAIDGDDLFVAKLDSAGNTLWAYSYGGVAGQDIHDIDVDSAGNLIVTGDFENTLTFGTDVLTSVDLWDGFVAKFDTDGAYQWSLAFGGTGYDIGRRVEADAAGAIFLIGDFDEEVSLGGSTLNDQGSDDVFVAKLDASGGHLWSLRMGSSDWENAWALGLDAAGNPVVGAEYHGTFGSPSQSHPNAGDEDLVVVKLDGATGAELWSRSFGGPGDEDLDDLAVDATGRVMLGAGSEGLLDMGDGPMLPASDDGSDDWVMALLDANGDLLYARRFGDPSDQDLRQVAVDSAGYWIATGECRGNIDLGNGMLWSGDEEDIVIGKFAP
ncbi:MAG: hypothetical protein JRI23_04405 [Deltaproteobacteria bacterium]|nr:hypothetical protein [Deltaproteobacteria bacterium]MBW2530782.1 hypothetical protein [Deltaproteobacteria bacterium]